MTVTVLRSQVTTSSPVASSTSFSQTATPFSETRTTKAPSGTAGRRQRHAILQIRREQIARPAPAAGIEQDQTLPDVRSHRDATAPRELHEPGIDPLDRARFNLELEWRESVRLHAQRRGARLETVKLEVAVDVGGDRDHLTCGPCHQLTALPRRREGHRGLGYRHVLRVHHSAGNPRRRRGDDDPQVAGLPRRPRDLQHSPSRVRGRQFQGVGPRFEVDGERTVRGEGSELESSAAPHVLRGNQTPRGGGSQAVGRHEDAFDSEGRLQPKHQGLLGRGAGAAGHVDRKGRQPGRPRGFGGGGGAIGEGESRRQVPARADQEGTAETGRHMRESLPVGRGWLPALEQSACTGYRRSAARIEDLDPVGLRPPPARSTQGPEEPSRSKVPAYSSSPPSVRRDAAPFVKPVSENRPSGPEMPAWLCNTGSSCATHDRPSSRTPATGRPSRSTVRPVTARPGASSTTGGTSAKRSNTAADLLPCETATAARSRSDTVRLTLPSAPAVSKPRGSVCLAAIAEPARTSNNFAPARGSPSAVARTATWAAASNASWTESCSGAASCQIEARPSAERLEAPCFVIAGQGERPGRDGCRRQQMSCYLPPHRRRRRGHADLSGGRRSIDPVRVWSLGGGDSDGQRP